MRRCLMATRPRWMTDYLLVSDTLLHVLLNNFSVYIEY
jgi:hypothetical protein